MRLTSLLLWLSATAPILAAITFRVTKVSNPTSDQADAYAKIESAMSAAVVRYNRLTTRPSKTITAQYVPGVQTADGNFNGNIRFGSNKSYMNERTALHEISHTLGIGQTRAFDTRCSANDWPSATRLLKSWDGNSAKINCGGGHIWPYGLNYDNEWSETNANRHCQLIDAMLADGLAS